MPEHLGGDLTPANGGTAIIGPNGEYLAGPVYGVEETLYAEIDLEAALREKHSRDIAGHYARPDVLQLVVNAAPKPIARFLMPLPHPTPRSNDCRGRRRPPADRARLLGSLISRIEATATRAANAAIAEAMESIGAPQPASGTASNPCLLEEHRPRPPSRAAVNVRALMHLRALPRRRDRPQASPAATP
jgi:hypothetical protein